MITTLKVKVYFLVPNYNYSNPLNSMNIVDFIMFYNPDIINPYIKLLPNSFCQFPRNTLYMLLHIKGRVLIGGVILMKQSKKNGKQKRKERERKLNKKQEQLELKEEEEKGNF